ncbi:MAG: AAA family ATPase [Patescibacteria group bacterium]
MKTYFVSGVNGVGKSTLIPHLREMLPADKYIVHDFDARGVPDGADHNWRKSEIQYWLEESARAAEESRETIICGFAKPEDFDTDSDVEIIVLDADEETVRQRLTNRYTKDGVFDENQKVTGKPVNEFIAGNVWYAKKMREECSAAGCQVIDTSFISPEEVAKKVVELIQAK